MKILKSIYNRNRLETFSDGIFAIIVTLLVLEIKVPHLNDANSVSEMSSALIGLLPKFLSWVISFFTVCVIWVNHHRLFNTFEAIDQGLFWWNAVLLLFVSFIPFPTALMGDYPNNIVAVSLYGVVLGLMGFSFYGMRMHAVKVEGLLNQSINKTAFRKGSKFTLLFGASLYFGGSALAWLHPYLAFFIYLAIPVYYIIPHDDKAI